MPVHRCRPARKEERRQRESVQGATGTYSSGSIAEAANVELPNQGTQTDGVALPS
jgi:hypothetical protein